MLTFLLILTVPVSTGALLYTRWEYRARGRLTMLGLGLAALMLFLPNLMLHYATTFEFSGTLMDFIGAGIGAAGLALCLVGIVIFQQVLKVVGLKTGTLAVAGPYRWSRNPQYVGWLFFLLGYALMDWSPWCLAALLVVAVCLHLTVLIEEEHLHRTFGEQYAEFCRKVPRYLGREHVSSQSHATVLLISATPEAAYDAITLHIDEWWTTLSKQAARVGDELAVRFEGNTSWVMTVTEAAPPRFLVWKVSDANHDLDELAVKDEWGGTTIRWEISGHETGSRLVFTHEGLTPELECYDICRVGWDYFLGSLKEFLETGKGYPYSGESTS